MTDEAARAALTAIGIAVCSMAVPLLIMAGFTLACELRGFLFERSDKKNVPLCRNCKHVSVPSHGFRYARCQHPKLANPGSDERPYTDGERRHFFGPCGSPGRLWEPKP